MTPSLGRLLWTGPLADPAEPARALATRIEAGADYPDALEALRKLVARGLPTVPALEVALGRWRWSIDLGLVAIDAGAEGALADLAARVAHQGRRHGVLARALWAAGRGDEARALLQRLDPQSPSHTADLEARFDLALAAGDRGTAEETLAALGPRIEAGPLARVRLRLAYDGGGAVDLAAALATAPPAQPGPWAWVLQVWLAERDFAQARAALQRLARLRDPAGTDHVLDSAQLALELEEPARALGHLATLPPAHPSDWPPRRHILHLRASLAEADAAPDPRPGWTAAADHAARALRLHPGQGALVHLDRIAAELTGDWDALAAALATASDPAAAGHLARLGLPDPARAPAPASPPESAATAARLACELAQLAGDPAAGLAAIEAAGPMPTAPLAAWLAEWRADTLLMLRRPDQAAALIGPVLARHPSRMGLWLHAARAAFFRGDFIGAEGALERFRALKTAQLGAPPATDLRDRITVDALAAGRPLPPADGPAPQGSPGLAAAWFARPGALPAFAPVAGAIPARLGHYWEGPLPHPVARGAARWARLHPALDQTLFDRPAAEAWLAAQAPEALPAFAAQTRAAARADLFRLCWLVQGGGVWADLDEYPRRPVDEWLTGAAGVLVLESGYGTVANNFLAARPGLPLLAQARAQALARLATATEDTWWDSGPARLTEALAATLATPGLRILSQSDYCTRVATNLPFPHKRRPDHWRPGPGARARP
jgi:hypothetical protein